MPAASTAADPSGQPVFEGGGVMAADGKDVWVADGQRVRKISFTPASPRPERQVERSGVPEGRLLLQTDSEGVLVSRDESVPTGIDVVYSSSSDGFFKVPWVYGSNRPSDCIPTFIPLLALGGK